MSVFLKFLSVLILVGVNAFFVASEFAMVKVRTSHLRHLVEEGRKRAKFPLLIKEHLDEYLSACQMGITIASLVLGWLGEPAVAEVLKPILEGQLHMASSAIHVISLVASLLLVTGLHITLGEQVPKMITIYNSEQVFFFTAPIMVVFYRLAFPLIWVFNKITHLLLTLFGYGHATEEEGFHSDKELVFMVNESYQHGLVDEHEQEFVENVFTFSDKSAREIMTPRTDMTMLRRNASIEDILRITGEGIYTRYPVMGKDKDDIVGFVHIKDLYNQLAAGGEISLKPVIREAIYVPESLELSVLLKQFQHKHVQLAVIVDEYGGTSGVITMEDILEEIVGEIQDEFDRETAEITPLEDGHFRILGKTPLEDVNEELEIELNDGDYDTLGGWIYANVPVLEEAATVEFSGWKFTVEKVEHHRIILIEVERVAAADDEEK